MLLDLQPWAVVVLNCAGLPCLQLGLAWIFNRLPAGWFESSRPVRVRRPSARLRQMLAAWKRWLPDGASWFAGGFAKARLSSRDPGYLRRFMAETRRGELCHWSFLLLCPVFFLWNPPWACGVIVVYAVVANMPCIVLQRVNRHRLAAVLARARD
ncbi:MAG: hypothetical protein EOP88_17785 [Verrucomicrobiaceae bacterium]|nr:MAG: hypothetical protein EOP88_17785 [Verrucomicrobiaceae bacterium]